MNPPLFRNFDYDTRATMLEKLKRKQKSRQKVAMLEAIALTDPLENQITSMPYAPAEPAPIGMLDGIYPQEDRESKPISSLDYGIVETHMADDGVSEYHAMPILAIKIKLAQIRQILRFNILPYVDLMYRSVIHPYVDIVFGWAKECRKIEYGEVKMEDFGGPRGFAGSVEEVVQNLRSVLMSAIDDKDIVLIWQHKEINSIIDDIINDLHKLT